MWELVQVLLGTPVTCYLASQEFCYSPDDNETFLHSRSKKYSSNVCGTHIYDSR